MPGHVLLVNVHFYQQSINVPSQSDAYVVASEAQGIGEGDVEVAADCFQGGIVQIAFRIGILKADGWRHNAVPEGKHRYNGFGSAGGTEHMAGHRL